ncbi:putative Cytosolic iron-sulfur assembly component 2A [Blattamonas nauphoetae]|uniref:Cytosolic iron-sulfur assembly component 2A n=1 Tax=Blattamonas nauphoetae TaxID=2049346 RepID=A0ABQ9YG63_9EUKA|nr:putative Cytosolic iron-sulfur assembly component 2A [Blattamonas nauphoetae]
MIPTVENIFDQIRGIIDPEIPNTLEDLKVVSPESVTIVPERKLVKIIFTPTVPHCTLCMLIGLCIRKKIADSLPEHWKILVQISEGSHNDENGVNKQLADKERVAAALENPNLAAAVAKSLTAKIESTSSDGDIKKTC